MHANKRAQQPPEFLVVGRVIRPHGIRGALIIEPLSPMIRSIEPESRILFGDPPEPQTIVQIRPHRERYLVTISDCSSREQAELFRGMELRLPFDDVEPLPEGEYYYWQILGLQVVTTDGESLGEVAQILQTGANDVHIVRSKQGEEQLIPAIEQVIKHVDLVKGKIEVEIISGLFNE